MSAITDEILARLATLDAQMRTLQAGITALLKQEKMIMVDLTELQTKADAELAQLTAETDTVNAVKLVVENQNSKIDALNQQIADLIAAGGADVNALQKLSDTLDNIKALDTSNAQVVADAVAEGTPVDPNNPPPTPAP